MEIYYVEDDRDIAEGVKTYLEARDFHVTILESVTDAKQALLKRQPAMIIIDWLSERSRRLCNQAFRPGSAVFPDSGHTSQSRKC